MYRSAERDQKSRFLGGETVLFYITTLRGDRTAAGRKTPLLGAAAALFIAASFGGFWERYL